jgi:acetyl-CoA C-acetyltransferase
MRAADALDSGRFEEVILQVGSFARDEHPRADSTIEKLSALPPLHPELEGATVTAGNSSGLNDAAAAVVMTSSDYAAAHGLAPMGRVVSWASVGVDPARTGLAPTLAIPKALERAGLTTADVDLWEINEAFCSMAVASSRILGLDHDIVNVNGSGCGLGHPIAATGARMVVTMLHELRRRGQSLGCVAMCAGGGMGSALVVELR